MSFDTFPLIKKLYDRLTEQRATWMDNLQYLTQTAMSRIDATVSSRAQETTTAKSAVCTDQRLSRLDTEVRGLRVIRRYSTTIEAGTATVDVPITAVADLSKSRVVTTFYETSPTTGSGLYTSLSATLTSTTNVRLQHRTSNSTTKVVEAEVIEFY